MTAQNFDAQLRNFDRDLPRDYTGAGDTLQILDIGVEDARANASDEEHTRRRDLAANARRRFKARYTPL